MPLAGLKQQINNYMSYPNSFLKFHFTPLLFLLKSKGHQMINKYRLFTFFFSFSICLINQYRSNNTTNQVGQNRLLSYHYRLQLAVQLFVGEIKKCVCRFVSVCLKSIEILTNHPLFSFGATNCPLLSLLSFILFTLLEYCFCVVLKVA